MKPIPTERTNINLVLDHDDATGDLPGEIIFDPIEPEPPVGIQSTWQLDEGERKAIANGAPALMTVWCGTLDPDQDPQVQIKALLAVSRITQPPISLTAGSPPAGKGAPLLDAGHVERAVGYLFGALNENGSFRRSGPDAKRIKAPFDYVVQHHAHGVQDSAPIMLQVDGFMALWAEAIAATREVPNQDGGSISDIALPSDVREDL